MSNSISESWIQSSHKLRARRAFTLVEMMVVLAIILILASIALVNFNSILSTTNSSEFSDFASTLVRARAYAMANNTYVWVGIQEVDASVSDSPGISQSTTGFGRIAVCAVASDNGTAIYQPNDSGSYVLTSPSNYTTTNPAPPLFVVTPLRTFNNLHILAHNSMPDSITTNLPGGSNSGSSGSGSGSSPGASFYYLDTNSSSTSDAVTTFQWPLTGTAQYTFGPTAGTVIQFDPQGEAQIVTNDDTNNQQENDSFLQWIEIDLEPTHGNNVPTSTSATTAAILIDGPSGTVSLYRS